MELRNGVFALVEVTDTTAKLLLTGGLQRMALQGRLRKAYGASVVAPVASDRGFSRFTEEQLISYVEDLGEPSPETGWDAVTLMETAIRLTLGAPRDTTSLEELKTAIAKLPDPDEDGIIRVKRKEPVLNSEGKVIPERPKKATGTTATVWTICDEVYAANPTLSLKEIRALIMAECENSGIHHGTAGVQYSKWKMAKSL